MAEVISYTTTVKLPELGVSVEVPKDYSYNYVSVDQNGSCYAYVDKPMYSSSGGCWDTNYIEDNICQIKFESETEKELCKSMVWKVGGEMNIINLTQHVTTKEQRDEGVFEPEDKAKVKELLTFDEPPKYREICLRANALAVIAKDSNAEFAIIGGAPYLMTSLAKALKDHGVTPLYSFSKRVSEEKDGVKTSTFKHICFIPAE